MSDWMLERGFEPTLVTLRRTVEESPGIKSFYFDYPRGRFTYKASQVVHLHLNLPGGVDAYHTFSIASSPTEDFLLFTMKMRPESQYKQALASTAPGAELVAVGPVGRFSLPEEPQRGVVFLGGGIGITPFRSMAKFATDAALPHRITLLYSNRTPEEIVFRSEWEEMRRRNPNLRVAYTMTRPEESRERWEGHTGRIDGAFVRENVEDLASSHFYLCGPPSMITEMASVLTDIGVGRGQIQAEAFPGYG